MLRILRRFSDRPQAAALIQELEKLLRSGRTARHGRLPRTGRFDDESLTESDTDDQQRLDPTGSISLPRALLDSSRLRSSCPLISLPILRPSRAPARLPPAAEAPLPPSPPKEHPWPLNRSKTLPTTIISAPNRVHSVASHAIPPRTPSFHPLVPSPASPGSVSATEGYARGPPSRSNVPTSSVHEASTTLRPRGPPSLQGGYTRHTYAPQSTAASVAGSNYPRQPEPGHYQRSTYAASSVGGRSVGTRTGPAPVYPPRPPSNAGSSPTASSRDGVGAPVHPSIARGAARGLKPRRGSRFICSRRRCSPSSSSNQPATARLYHALMKHRRRRSTAHRPQRRRTWPRSESARSSFSPRVEAPPPQWRCFPPLDFARTHLGGAGQSGRTTGSRHHQPGARVELLLYAFKRVTGRGDPLLMLRLLKRLQQALLSQSTCLGQAAGC